MRNLSVLTLLVAILHSCVSAIFEAAKALIRLPFELQSEFHNPHGITTGKVIDHVSFPVDQPADGVFGAYHNTPPIQLGLVIHDPSKPEGQNTGTILVEPYLVASYPIGSMWP